MPIYALDGFEPELPDDGQFWIAPTAVLIGRVRLKKNASVWFGVVLRGDTDWIEVGENSNVQDNSVCHADPGFPTVIGANVTVGHSVILHSTTIGDNALIGMGSTLLNRSNIGANCLVGANALIPEGKVFEVGSLILGAPAKVARSLSEAERAAIGASAGHYVENHRRFRDRLRRLD